MTYIIIKQPHPLDAIWSHAMEVAEEAQEAIDALSQPYTNEEVDPLVEKRMAAALAVIALPARNIADCIYKLDLTGPLDDPAFAGCDRASIITEALGLIDVGMSRGNKLLKGVPGLLEGVSL